ASTGRVPSAHAWGNGGRPAPLLARPYSVCAPPRGTADSAFRTGALLHFAVLQLSGRKNLNHYECRDVAYFLLRRPGRPPLLPAASRAARRAPVRSGRGSIPLRVCR